MASFTGQLIKDTYDGILKTIDNGVVDSTAKNLTDGVGNLTPLWVSTTQLGVGVTPTTDFHVNGAALIGGSLTITGDLTVNGTTTTISTQTLSVEDPLIILANDNAANSVDIGFYGKYVDGSTKYTGLFRKAGDNKFHIFSGLGTEPITTVNTGDASYVVSTLVGDLEGNVTGNLIATGGGATQIASDVRAVTQAGADSSTKVATTAFVQQELTGSDLDFSGTSGTGSVDLDSQTFAVVGTSNEIETTAGSQQLQIGLPNDVTIANDLTVSNDLDVTGVITTAGVTEQATQFLFTKDLRVHDVIPAITLSDSDSAGAAALGDIQWIDSGATQKAILSLSSSNLEIASKAGGLNFSTNSTNALTIDTSQDSTFAGDVTLASGNALRWTSDDVRIEGTTAGDNIKFYVGGSQILELAQSGTLATFAGEVEFGSLTSTTVGATIAKFVTEAQGIASNDNDTTIPTSAAIKDYVDTKAALTDTLTEVLAIGNTTGATIIEVDNTSGGIDFIDDAKARFGTGNDLEIYHDGAISIIEATGSSTAGSLRLITPTNLQLRTENVATVSPENILGYHNNNNWFSLSTGIGNLVNASSGQVGYDLYLTSVHEDKDIYIQGNDGTARITALKFDMSEGGAATFSGTVTAGRNLDLSSSDYTYLQGTHTGAGDGDYLMRTFGYGDSTFYGSFDILKHDTDDGELRLRQRIAGTATDVLSIVDGNSTFAGTTIAGGGGAYSYLNPIITASDSTADAPKSIAITNQYNGSSAEAKFIVATYGNSWHIGMGSNTHTYGNDLTFTADATSANAPKLRISTAGNSTFAGNVNIDAAGDLYINSGSSYNNKGSIFMSNQRTEIVSDIVNLTANGDTSLNFKTRSAGATASAMFIDEFRNVGIGTTAPAYNLDIESATHTVLRIHAGTNSSASLRLKNDAQDWDLNTQTNDTFAIYNQTSATQPFSILPSGDVGIGTTSPSSTLTLGNATDNVAELRVLRSNASSSTYAYVDTVGGTAQFGGTGDARLRADGASNIYFTTNATERMRITSGGQVQVGYYNTARGGANTTFMTGKSGTTYLELNGGDVNGEGGILFADGSGGNYGLINYSHASDIMQFYTDAAERMRITSGGEVLIRRADYTDTTFSLQVGDAASDSYRPIRCQVASTSTRTQIAFYNSPTALIGTISSAGTSTAYNTTSDYRLKEDLQDFNGLDKVSKIKMYDFKWKTDESRSYGAMAHELQEVLPQAVTGEKDAEENQMVDYSKIVPLLVKSIQELTAKVEMLEKNCQCKK